ncbi:hypothetical protein HYPSUDRAFT_40786 [Hypholoma sublateritium FD-334 SS-4]|uniref:Uncharacterized protein n=1 Tax=Hypholoma sublateritium (strain FD-334 SS-4) TaxID=945553 RepID=A0A0D2PSH8_HYPSF|nr:hypothetical protein HYPSUDRAFT_40786 [Hypholoma sublateritium FD-334 SS-4]
MNVGIATILEAARSSWRWDNCAEQVCCGSSTDASYDPISHFGLLFNFVVTRPLSTVAYFWMTYMLKRCRGGSLRRLLERGYPRHGNTV